MGKENFWPHGGHRERLRQLIEENSVRDFPAYLVLEFILTFGIPYKDTRSMAKDLLAKYGTLRGVFKADQAELLEVKNMTKNAALLLKTFGEMTEFGGESFDKKITITADNLLIYLRSLFVHEFEEKIVLISLDDDFNVLSADTLSSGNVGSVAISASQVGKIIDRTDAKTIILGHNHPSALLMPSQEDYVGTDYIGTLAKKKNVKLLDHIIICDALAYSLFLRCQMDAGPNSTYPLYKYIKKTRLNPHQ